VQCPTAQSQITNAVSWIRLTEGTPDYYHPCSNPSNAGVPNNVAGHQTPRTGLAYAGLHVTNAPNWREYITAMLTDTLKANNEYYVELFVCHADFWASIGSDGLGVYFSPTIPDTTGVGTGVLALTPQVQNPSGNIITDTVNWVKVSGFFCAEGAEKYITIGNFRDDLNTQGAGMYFYVEDISVVDADVCDSSLFVHSAYTVNNLEIYPNPTTGKFRVESLELGVETIQIFDLFGRLVLRTNKVQVDMSGFAKGLYIWQVGSERGKLIIE